MNLRNCRELFVDRKDRDTTTKTGDHSNLKGQDCSSGDVVDVAAAVVVAAVAVVVAAVDVVDAFEKC